MEFKSQNGKNFVSVLVNKWFELDNWLVVEKTEINDGKNPMWKYLVDTKKNEEKLEHSQESCMVLYQSFFFPIKYLSGKDFEYSNEGRQTLYYTYIFGYFSMKNRLPSRLEYIKNGPLRFALKHQICFRWTEKKSIYKYTENGAQQLKGKKGGKKNTHQKIKWFCDLS